MDMYRTPILTARDAARHLGMPESTLDAWVAARPDHNGEPLIHAMQPERRGWPRLPFVAIIEAFVLRSLRELRFSMDDIEIAADVVRAEFGDQYALASQRIATDGASLFVELADKSIVQPHNNQLGIREVVEDYLRFITWDDEGKPKRLRLRQYPERASVIIDPRFGWGAPVLEDSKVPVESIRALWRNKTRMSVIAREFDLPTDVIEDVLQVAA